MARHHRWPTHARSGQGDPARTVRAPPRPGIRAAPFSSHQVPDRRPKSACRARTASPKSQCGTRARPAQSTNPHSPSRAARGFLHVRISYAKSARNPSTKPSFGSSGLNVETCHSFRNSHPRIKSDSHFSVMKFCGGVHVPGMNSLAQRHSARRVGCSPRPFSVRRYS